MSVDKMKSFVDEARDITQKEVVLLFIIVFFMGAVYLITGQIIFF